MPSTPDDPPREIDLAAAAGTIGGLPVAPGDHICAFYRGTAERDSLILPFLREGVRAGHKCICITSPTDHARIASTVLAGPGPVPGRLQLEDFDTTYLRSGSFLGEEMLAYWQEWAEQTFDREGWEFARGVTDMSWAESIVAEPAFNDFLSYELRATRLARSYPQVALCLYDLDRFGGNVIIPVMKVHPKVLFGGILVDNPYFLEPDDALAGG